MNCCIFVVAYVFLIVLLYIHTYIPKYVRTYVHTYIHTYVYMYIYIDDDVCDSLHLLFGENTPLLGSKWLPAQNALSKAHQGHLSFCQPSHSYSGCHTR